MPAKTKLSPVVLRQLREFVMTRDIGGGVSLLEEVSGELRAACLTAAPVGQVLWTVAQWADLGQVSPALLDEGLSAVKPRDHQCLAVDCIAFKMALAYHHHFAGRHAQAIWQFQNAYGFDGDASDPDLRAEINFMCARANAAFANYTEAYDCLDRADQAAVEGGREAARGVIALGRALVAIELGLRRDVEANLEFALRMLEHTTDSVARAMCEYAAAKIQRRHGQFAVSIERSRAAVRELGRCAFPPRDLKIKTKLGLAKTMLLRADELQKILSNQKRSNGSVGLLDTILDRLTNRRASRKLVQLSRRPDVIAFLHALEDLGEEGSAPASSAAQSIGAEREGMLRDAEKVIHSIRKEVQENPTPWGTASCALVAGMLALRRGDLDAAFLNAGEAFGGASKDDRRTKARAKMLECEAGLERATKEPDPMRAHQLSIAIGAARTAVADALKTDHVRLRAKALTYLCVSLARQGHHADEAEIRELFARAKKALDGSKAPGDYLWDLIAEVEQVLNPNLSGIAAWLSEKVREVLAGRSSRAQVSAEFDVLLFLAVEKVVGRGKALELLRVGGGKRQWIVERVGRRLAVRNGNDTGMV